MTTLSDMLDKINRGEVIDSFKLSDVFTPRLGGSSVPRGTSSTKVAADRDEAIKAIQGIIVSPLFQPTTVDLSGMGRDCGLVNKIISTLPSSVVNLNLSGTNLDKTVVKCLADFLPTSHLDTLILRNCALWDDQCVTVVNAIPASLTHLYLDGRNLTSVHTVHALVHLLHSSHLQVLALDAYYVSLEHQQMIQNAVLTCHTSPIVDFTDHAQRPTAAAQPTRILARAKIFGSEREGSTHEGATKAATLSNAEVETISLLHMLRTTGFDEGHAYTINNALLGLTGPKDVEAYDLD